MSWIEWVILTPLGIDIIYRQGIDNEGNVNIIIIIVKGGNSQWWLKSMVIRIET